MYYESNYLSHHGVKGMKWGVRHDPERKGRRPRKRLPESSGYKHKAAVGEESKQRKGLTAKQKRNIAIGAAAVATILAVRGGRKLNNFVTSKNLELGHEAASESMRKYMRSPTMNRLYLDSQEHIRNGNSLQAKKIMNKYYESADAHYDEVFDRYKKMKFSERAANVYLNRKSFK